MQTDGLDSWTWSGATARPVWVPNSAPGPWMWLLAACMLASFLALLVILIVDCPDAISTLAGREFQPLIGRPIGSLTPREIVCVLAGLREQPTPGPPDSSSAIANSLRAELRRWECPV